jgi:membrane-associated protease RseP (regulator of RpoE activity)
MKNFTLLFLAGALMIGAPFSSAAQDASTTTEKPFLGMYFQHISVEAAANKNLVQPYGGLATSIFEGSPADRAGLQKEDYVIAIDDNFTSENLNLQQVVEMYKPCDKVVVTYMRDGEKFSATTILCKRPVGYYFRDKRKGNDPFLGAQFGHTQGTENLVVGSVTELSAASEIGLQKLDNVTSINGTAVNYNNVRSVVARLKAGKRVKVEFVRDGKKMSASTILKTKAETFMYIECEQAEELDDLTAEELALLEEKAAVIGDPASLGIGSVNFFPNPSNGQFDLMFNLYDVGDVNIQIFNSNGGLVYNEQIAGFTGYFNNNVDISNNAKGIYFLIVEQNGKTVSKKVVLQ